MCPVLPSSFSEVSVLLPDRAAHLLFATCLHKPRQHLHVALAALDFLVEDHAVETLAAFGQLLRRDRGARCAIKPKRLNVTLHHRLRFLDPLGNLHLLLAGQQRDLAHLLEIHPHRIIENVELRSRASPLPLPRVFLPVLITIDLGGLDDIDLHAAEPRQNGVDLIRIVYLLRAVLRLGRRK